MVGVKRTARQPGELITAVTVPLLDGWQGYAKVGVRNAMVIAISGRASPSTGRPVPCAWRWVPWHRRSCGRQRRRQLAAGDVDWANAAVAHASVDEFGRLAAGGDPPDR